MSVAIGIDLGTTNTVVAAVVDGVAVTLEDEQGRRLLPSVVSFHPSGTVLVGEAARERRLIDPENTVFSVKTLLGRPFDGPEAKLARSRLPFRLTEGAKNSVTVTARDVAYALPEISAFVLRRAKAIAEAALGEPVDRAVITVPANFNDLQRASTKIAGKLAGLDVMRILNEPTAAALAYGQSIESAEKIAVYDLGGGTFDVTLLDLTGNVFEVLATAGDTALGGDDVDGLLADALAIEVIKRFNFDPRTNLSSFGRLRFIAEDLKKELSVRDRVVREISGIGHGEFGVPIEMSVTVTRDDLERIIKPLVERTMVVARQSIEQIALKPSDFDRVILVGGSTRMPMVARMVETLFGQAPHVKVNPDEVVALGAAIQAHALHRSKSTPKRKSAHEQLAGAQPAPAPAPAPAPPPALRAAEPKRAPPPLPTGTKPAKPGAPRVTISRGVDDVPPAPRVPTDLEAPPPAPAQPAFFELTKAAAVISFSSVAPEQDFEPMPKPKPARSGPSYAPPPAPIPPELDFDAPFDAPFGAPDAPYAPNAPNGIGASPHDVPDLAAAYIPPARGAVVLAPRGSSHSGLASADELFNEFEFDLLGATQDAKAEEDAYAAYGAPPVVMQSAPTAATFARGSAIATSANAPLLIDVTPLSLRVETVGGYCDVLIAANSPVPCEKTRTFLTASDHQTVVFIRVAQGESARFAENTYLGELELSGLKPATRGEVKILVTFELDADGILNVRALDTETRRETQTTMRLLGASTDQGAVDAMVARQARHVVA